MIMQYILKPLKYLFIIMISIVGLFLGTIYSLKFYQWRKFETVMSIDIMSVQSGCEEGCLDYKVQSVSTSEFVWLRGKIVNIRQYSDKYKKGLPQEWYDQGYKVFCVTGRLHKAKDHFFWFYPRDVYNFTGSAITPGMCSNLKAKRFKW
jgi:hypothetical protein